MSDKPTAARDAYGQLAPKFAEVTDEVLFGDIWRQPDLSPRDRSVVTVSSLISLYRINELPYHVKIALDNGVTKQEIIAMITHLAFYSGWPTAASAMTIANKVFTEAGV
jgi:4-carboxymuconolactone decarboxylase